MQPIQRTSCPDGQSSSATYLAAMIDERTRDNALSSAISGIDTSDHGTGTQRLDASVLIWVEGDAKLARDPAGGRHRCILVVAHGSGQTTTEGSFIISFPVDADDRTPHVPAVSGALKAMGWSVLSSRHGRIAGGQLNTAMLISTARSGQEQRLWLAEPVGKPEDLTAPAYA